MSKSIFILGFALAFLGFLASTTLNMRSDIEKLQAENQMMADNLTQLSSTYEIIVQERDALKNQNTELVKKIDTLQQAYLEENHARLKAESDLATLKSTVNNMIKGSTILSHQTEQLPGHSKAVSLAAIPFTTGFITLLAIISLVLKAINFHHMNKYQQKENLQARRFPQSIPRLKSSNI